MSEQNEAEKQRKIGELRDKAAETKLDIKEANDECEAMQTEFNSIKDNVQQMVEMFIKAKF